MRTPMLTCKSSCGWPATPHIIWSVANEGTGRADRWKPVNSLPRDVPLGILDDMETDSFFCQLLKHLPQTLFLSAGAAERACEILPVRFRGGEEVVSHRWPIP